MTREDALKLNQPIYQGQPCPSGHSGLRYSRGRGECVECVKLRHARNLTARNAARNLAKKTTVKIETLSNDPFDSQAFVESGRELSQLWQDYQESAPPDESLCACGCLMPHLNRVSRVINRYSDFGTPQRKVLWYCSVEHKGKSR